MAAGGRGAGWPSMICIEQRLVTELADLLYFLGELEVAWKE